MKADLLTRKGTSLKIFQLHSRKDVSISKPRISATKKYYLQLPGVICEVAYGDLEALEILIKHVRQDLESEQRVARRA